MDSLLAHLFKRGISGSDSSAEHRVLQFLADPQVNRRLFGQPISATLGYYLEDYLCIVGASERYSRVRK